MLNKERVISLIIAIAVFFGVFTGCASSSKTPAVEGSETQSNVQETNVSSASDESAGTVQVDIFQYKVEFKETFQELASAYMAENPGVVINVTTVGGGEDWRVALKAKFASGDEPAVFNIGGPQDMENWMSKLEPVGDTKAAAAAAAGTLDAVTKDGNIYGLPYCLEGIGLIYNKEILDKAGINAEEITSFEKLEEAAKTIDAKKSELGLDAVFAYHAKDVSALGQHTATIFTAPEFGDMATAFNAKTIEFRYSDAFKNYIDLMNTYSIQPVLNVDYTTQVEQNFSMGKVAMIQQGNWIYPVVNSIDEELAANMGMIPVPIQGIDDQKMAVGVPNYWAVNKDKAPDVIAAAKDFLDYVYTSDVGKDYVLDVFKFIPAYDGYDASRITDPLSSTIYSYVQEGKTMNWVFNGFPTDWAKGKLAVSIQKYLAGEESWEDAIRESKQSWEELRQ